MPHILSISPFKYRQPTADVKQQTHTNRQDIFKMAILLYSKVSTAPLHIPPPDGTHAKPLGATEQRLLRLTLSPFSVSIISRTAVHLLCWLLSLCFVALISSSDRALVSDSNIPLAPPFFPRPPPRVPATDLRGVSSNFLSSSI
jgi:hypothetical protein